MDNPPRAEEPIHQDIARAAAHNAGAAARVNYLRNFGAPGGPRVLLPVSIDFRRNKLQLGYSDHNGVISRSSFEFSQPAPQGDQRFPDLNLKNMLEILGLQGWIQIFSRHRIAYIEFLQLTEQNLVDLGMRREEDRTKVLSFIEDFHVIARSQGLGYRYSRPSTVICYREMTACVENLSAHVRRWEQTINALKVQLIRDPTGLKYGLEEFPVNDIILNLMEIIPAVENVTAETSALRIALSRKLPGEQASEELAVSEEEVASGEETSGEEEEYSIMRDLAGAIIFGMFCTTIYTILKLTRKN